MRTSTLAWSLAFATAFAVIPAHAAADTAANALTADLARHYFASPAQEVAARADLDSALARLERLRGRLDSAQRLADALRLDDEVLDLTAQHEGYLHVLCSQDRTSPACDADERLETDVDARTAFFATELLAMSEDRLREFAASSPEVARHAYAIAEVRRDAGHARSGPEQAVLDRVRPLIADWQFDLYQQILAGIDFGTVPAQGTTLDVLRQRNAIAANPDARVREAGFRRRYAGFASRRDLFAFTLLHTVQARAELARSHRDADAPARKYRELRLDPDSTRALLAAMALHADVVRRFQQVRGADFERAGLGVAHVWDMTAPPAGVALPPTPLPELRPILHATFARLGPDYQRQFDALLDPAAGRADVRPGGGHDRYGGGFSIGSRRSPSVLFFGRYDGTFKDISVIAHEGGHAVHRQLMNDNGVLPCYAEGPSYLFESFAAFNELLLADDMAARAHDPESRRYYLERWFDIKGLDAFYGAEDALLEQAIYDSVAAGVIHGADDLDRLTTRVCGPFSRFYADTPELASRWATISLMVEDPLYDVNYVYGGLLALEFAHLDETRHDWFVPRYMALLRNGFDAPPEELLRRFLGIDLSSRKLLDDALGLLDERLRRLEATPAR